MRILSWNVNGIRSAHKKGLVLWLDSCNADIVGVQEVRATTEQVPSDITDCSSWHKSFVSAQKKGYSGVGLFSKKKLDSLVSLLDEPKYDDEGRLQIATFGKLLLANVYFPNGGGKNRDNSRIPYKLSFYATLLERLLAYKKEGWRILVLGDFNTAHKEIDLARPRTNKNTSGFCLNERQEFDRWCAAGFVDTFRQFNKDAGQYTWWSNRQNSRQRNVGWRIDYVLACQDAMQYITDAFILSDVLGSDHCPIGVEVKDQIIA